MNKQYKLGFALVLILSTSFGIKAQQSDYQIKSDFISGYQALEFTLTDAINVRTVDSLEKEIILLDSRFNTHKDLLDNALYPQSYRSIMTKLQIEANIAEQRLLIIENQKERLEKLSNKVAYFENEIAFLNNRADSLRRAIENSQTSEEHLASLVRRYRENLELRDELIIDVIDSLMVSYNGFTTKKLNEIAEQVESGRITVSNPLEMIDSILEENIEYVSKTNQALSVEDHLRMYAVQNHFEDVWSKIGDMIITSYGGSNKNEWNRKIDTHLKDWRMVTAQKMWNSMDQYLDFSDVDLGAFDNNYSFFIALDNFVKEAQKKSENEIISTQSYQDYKKFQKFWSAKIKNEWSSLIQESEVLTIAQISSIDEQLSNWEFESRPIHPFFLILLVLTSVSIGGYVLVMVKSKSA